MDDAEPRDSTDAPGRSVRSQTPKLTFICSSSTLRPLFPTFFLLLSPAGRAEGWERRPGGEGIGRGKFSPPEQPLVSSSNANGGPKVSAPRQTARARELRKHQTPAEEALWQLLRNRRLLRLKFRRQVPLGPYIADFYCHRYRLVVELDGPVHEEHEQIAHDEDRALYLSVLGVTILRVPNQRVFDEPRGRARRDPRSGRLGRLADGYDEPQMLTTARRCLRWLTEPYDGPQMLTTTRRALRQAADHYASPQILTPARR